MTTVRVMRSANSEESPFVAKPGQEGHRRFLENLRLDHGPIDELGSFLLRAERAMSDHGVTLYNSPMSELARVNEVNQQTWKSFSPILDFRLAPLDRTNSYCVTGRDPSGEVVVLIGGKLIDTGERTLQETADDQSIYYGQPHSPSLTQPRCVMTVPVAKHLKGRFNYSGGLWVKPSYRGRGFPAIMERISRMFALGQWGTSHAISFVTDELANSPVLLAYGYKNIQPSYSIVQDGAEAYRGSLIWMEAKAAIDDMREFGSNGLSKIDRAVIDGRRKDIAAAS